MISGCAEYFYIRGCVLLGRSSSVLASIAEEFYDSDRDSE